MSVAGMVGPVSAGHAEAVAAPGDSAVTGEAVISALEGAYGVHPGQRRNHTKGVGALGRFVGNPEAASYSRSALFSGREVEVVGRFSVAGGDPDASDTEKSPRGLGLEFRLPGGFLHHMTMIHTPMFFAAVPRTFLDKFIALKVDSRTGKPDPEKFKAFNASHPDIKGQSKFLADSEPPPSYANCAFYGIHTFKFIDRAGKTSLVKFRFVPQDGEKQLTASQQQSFPPNFLEKALVDRVARGPMRWDMILTIGEPGDPQNDPTQLWPAGRKEVKAGILTIHSVTPSAVAGSYGINFDPMVLADGISATDDPVLRFRSPSYGVSYSKRLQGL